MKETKRTEIKSIPILPTDGAALSLGGHETDEHWGWDVIMITCNSAGFLLWLKRPEVK